MATQVGTTVFCNKGNLKNAEGVVVRTGILGVKKSVIVKLADDTQVAFFGEDVKCVTIEPVTNTEVTTATDNVATTSDPPPPSSKRILRKDKSR